MLKSFLRLTLALALPALALATPATANVRSSGTGNSCIFFDHEIFPPHGLPGSNPAHGNVFGVYRSSGGIMVDAGTATDGTRRWPVSCPLTRSLPLSTDGLSDLEIRFYAETDFAGEPFRTVTCTASSLRSDGSFADTASKDVNVPPYPSGVMTVMDFGGALNVSSSKGHYTLTCHLPGDVVLHSVYHSEVDGVNGN
jgi:hypothetical protein